MWLEMLTFGCDFERVNARMNSLIIQDNVV